MPAASVSENSTLRRVLSGDGVDVSKGLLGYVWQERHETSPLHSERHGMLARGGATTLATREKFALPVHHLPEQIEILVVNIHRTGTNAVDENRILLLCLDLRLGLSLRGLCAGAGRGHKRIEPSIKQVMNWKKRRES